MGSDTSKNQVSNDVKTFENIRKKHTFDKDRVQILLVGTHFFKFFNRRRRSWKEYI